MKAVLILALYLVSVQARSTFLQDDGAGSVGRALKTLLPEEIFGAPEGLNTFSTSTTNLVATAGQSASGTARINAGDISNALLSLNAANNDITGGTSSYTGTAVNIANVGEGFIGIGAKSTDNEATAGTEGALNGNNINVGNVEGTLVIQGESSGNTGTGGTYVATGNQFLIGDAEPGSNVGIVSVTDGNTGEINEEGDEGTATTTGTTVNTGSIESDNFFFGSSDTNNNVDTAGQVSSGLLLNIGNLNAENAVIVGTADGNTAKGTEGANAGIEANLAGK